MGKPKYVAYPPILDPSQRTGAIGGLYGQGLEFLNQGADYLTEGAQRFFQPSFDFAFDVLQPFSEQIGPYTDAIMRQSRRSFEQMLPYQEQAFQKAGAFFTPDFLKARSESIYDQQQTEQDFLTKLMFGLTETGVNLGQNLVSQNLQGAQLGLQTSQLGGSWLDQLLGQQFQVEQGNVDLENAKRQMDRANQFDWGNLMQTAAPFASFIPGVGPLLSAGLSIGGSATSQAQGLGGGGGFGDYLSNMMTMNAIREQLDGRNSITSSSGTGFRNPSNDWFYSGSIGNY